MNIYVGNLADDVQENELKEIFEAFGQVDSVKIIKDFYTGLPRGFGFVEMSGQEEGQSAITDLDGTVLKEKTIKVNEARPRNNNNRRGGGGGGGGNRRGGGGGGRRY